MSSAVTIVLLDANILYSRTLRDWIALLQVKAPGLFNVTWTEDIPHNYFGAWMVTPSTDLGSARPVDRLHDPDGLLNALETFARR
jgi:hypothetical protein